MTHIAPKKLIFIIQNSNVNLDPLGLGYYLNKQKEVKGDKNNITIISKASSQGLQKYSNEVVM
ncbi:hypothetical protein GH721_04595 [Kriegella sp. EG-1]|nr:hypothetical protein [Flavobacteriaceae bacterium EG-1]